MVNSKELWYALVLHKAYMVRWRIRADRGIEEPKPSVPEEVGAALLELAQRLTRHKNFIGSPLKDDLVGNAVLKCLRYIDSFDPGKSKNPFSYFTTVCRNSFIDTIKGNWRVVDREREFGEIVHRQGVEFHAVE